jgi:predicted dehydrogenase
MTGTVVVRGLGSIGRRHATVLSDLGADVHGWPVRPRPGDMDGIRLVTDTQGAEMSGRADLVVIATDTARHVDDALDALDAGAARVLLEKPVAPTAEAAGRLWQHPEAAYRVFVAAPLRAHLGFLEFRDRALALPTPATAHVFSQSWLPDWRPDRDYRESYSARADEGGVLRDLVHEIDYAVAVFGPPADGSIRAVVEWDGPLQIAAEQGATMLWRTSSATVTLRLDYTTRPARRGALLTTADGSVAWDPVSGSVSSMAPDGSVDVVAFPEDLDRNGVMARQMRAALSLAPAADAELLLRAGAPATLAEGVLAVRICDDARGSADVREAVHPSPRGAESP